MTCSPDLARLLRDSMVGVASPDLPHLGRGDAQFCSSIVLVGPSECSHRVLVIGLVDPTSPQGRPWYLNKMKLGGSPKAHLWG